MSTEQRAADGRQEKYTATLARYAVGLKFEDIPPSVIQAARNVMLDGLGCGLFGSTLKWPAILTDLMRENEGSGPASIWGTNIKASPTNATMVNGTSVHSFEIDDVHPKGGRQHAESVVIPPVIALAEQQGRVSGRDALTAIVAGVEIGSRIGLSLGVNSAAIGWHAPAVCGVFPAAVAAGRCLQLSEQQMNQAIGLAATQASGLHGGHKSGAMSKHWHAGKAAQSGLYAALLAARGFTGPEDVLELDRGGFCNTFMQGRSNVDLTRLTQGLGQVWETSRLHFKLYTCRGTIHTPLDALRQLRQQYGFGANDVAKVTVWGGQNVGSSGFPYVAGSTTRAQMNMAYCLAVMLIDGECFIDQFTPEKAANPGVLALTQKIQTIHDPAIDQLGSAHQHHIRIEVLLKDGRRLESELAHAAGGDETPIPHDQLTAKFLKLAGKAVPAQRAHDILEQVESMERLPDVAIIGKLMGGDLPVAR